MFLLKPESTPFFKHKNIKSLKNVTNNGLKNNFINILASTSIITINTENLLTI